jgi:hypothetical protein
MIIKFLLSALFGSIVAASVYWLVPDHAILIDFYGENIRGSLFTGFLTLGGFLLSLKTFIIVKMKENVYDNEKYIEIYNNNKKLNNNLLLYAPLQKLSHLLFWAILSCIVTSVLQFSLGLFQYWIAPIICIFMAAFSVSLLILSLIEIKNNLDRWFEFLEESKT